MADHCPLKRSAVPEDVARVVAFLASDDGGWVNGKPSNVPNMLLCTFIADDMRRPSYHHLRRLFSVKGAGAA